MPLRLRNFPKTCFVKTVLSNSLWFVLTCFAVNNITIQNMDNSRIILIIGMLEADRQQLVDDHFLFVSGDKNLIAAGMERDWPEGKFSWFQKNFTKKIILEKFITKIFTTFQVAVFSITLTNLSWSGSTRKISLELFPWIRVSFKIVKKSVEKAMEKLCENFYELLN